MVELLLRHDCVCGNLFSCLALRKNIVIFIFHIFVAKACNKHSVSNFLFSLALQPNSGLGRLHKHFHFTLVTRSRTVSRTPWTGYNRTTATFNYVNDLMFNLSIYCNHF
jgi:hypothetical protein